MGMYTEFVLGVNLREDTPKYIIDILRYMTGENVYLSVVLPDHKLPNHPLFQTEGWRMMLIGCSGYFPGDSSNPILRVELSGCLKRYHLTIRSRFKNYDYEIELFLDWISEYLEDGWNGNCIGYCRDEEHPSPILIYVDKNYKSFSMNHPIQLGIIFDDDVVFKKKSLLEFMPDSWWVWKKWPRPFWAM